MEAAGLEAALSWSKGTAPVGKGGGKPPTKAGDQPSAALTPEAIAANAAAQVDADACCTQVGLVSCHVMLMAVPLAADFACSRSHHVRRPPAGRRDESAGQRRLHVSGCYRA